MSAGAAGGSGRSSGTLGLPGANPYKAFYSMVRTRPVALLRQVLLQQLALHLQQLQQQHPLPAGADPAQHLQQLQQLQQQQAKSSLGWSRGLLLQQQQQQQQQEQQEEGFF
ncbi:hypothetical protein EBH_0021450 [Eimeria brunetti]|uniref:Uncharacterized protein n=1 Tax=Eimeria brunetti TaxID=51314 RepID=U6LER1_9EIME|nr:hypothetical protein EBH_0021450 [Eimeria brunetti]